MALGRSTDLSVEISGDAAGLERALVSAERATQRAERAALGYDSSLSRLGSDIAKLEKQIDDDITAQLNRQHDAMDKAGKGLVTFGAAVALGLGLAGREAMQWEEAWTGVTKTVEGTPEELARVEEQLRGLAKTLTGTHEEIAAVAEAAGQLGVETSNVSAFTKTMIDLGETTNLSANDAATQLARFANIMGTAAGDVDRLGSTIVGLGNNFETTEAEIVELGLRLAAAGKQAGLSESDVFAFATTLTSVGVQAEAGGTALSKVFTKITDSVRDGGSELEVFAEVAGMSTSEFAAAFEEDAAGAINAWVQGMGRIAETGGSTTQVFEALELTDQRLMRAILSTASAGDHLNRTLEHGETAWAENLALLEEAEKRYGTAGSQAKIAMNGLKDSAIDIGAVVLPALAAVAEVVGDLTAFFGEMPGPVKASIGVMAALGAAVALTGGAALIAIPKWVAFKTTIEGLNAGALKTAGSRMVGLAGILAGPWGLAITGGIAALGFFAAKQGQAAQMVDALAQSLDQQTGAITDQTRELVFKEMWDSGAIENARELGLNIQMVTDAALGNKDAIAALDAAYGSHRDQVTAASDSMGVVDSELQTQSATWTRLRGVIGESNGVIGEARGKLDAAAEAGLNVKGGADAAADGADGMGDSFSGAEDAASGLTEEVKSLGDQLDELSGDYLDNRAAGRAVREQLRTIRKATRDYVKENGNLKGAFKQGTKSGDEFAGMLDDLAGKEQDRIDTVARVTGSEKKAMEQYRQSRAELRRMAVQILGSEEAAEKYIKRVLGTPKMVRTQFQTPGLNQASSSLDSLLGKLNQLDGRTARAYVSTIYSSKGHTAPGIQEHAEGGWIRGPGGPRDDKILARLSNGEFVMNADSSREYGPLLEAMNAKRFADGGFVGGKATQIDFGFLIGQQRGTEGTPNLRGYRQALRGEARALREVRREREQLKEVRKQAAEAEKAAEKRDTPANRKRAREAARELEKAENQLARAKDRHAKSTDRVSQAVSRYADAQAAQVARAKEVAANARQGGTVFGSDFSDPGSVSQRIQATLARVREFTELRRRLVRKGIHPSLLAQLDAEGPTEGGVMFAREVLASPESLADLNKQSAQLETATIRLGAQTAAVRGPLAGREVRYGGGAGQTFIINTQVNAPQNMNPEQVGQANASKIMAKLKG